MHVTQIMNFQYYQTIIILRTFKLLCSPIISIISQCFLQVLSLLSYPQTIIAHAFLWQGGPELRFKGLTDTPQSQGDRVRFLVSTNQERGHSTSEAGVVLAVESDCTDVQLQSSTIASIFTSQLEAARFLGEKLSLALYVENLY